MSGTNFNYLVALREAYPATTSACHNMVMLAAALRRKKQGSSWNDINGQSRAYAAFDRALNETINSIEQETGEANLICNLTFLDEYLVRFMQACPDWSKAYDEISEKIESLRKTTRCVQSKKRRNDGQERCPEEPGQSDHRLTETRSDLDKRS